MQRPALALLSLVLLAGCAAPAAELPAAPGAEVASSLFLDPEGGMGAASPDGASVPLRWGWGQWLTGVEAPAWRSAPAERPYVVTSAIAHVVYEADQHVVAVGTRPSLTVWWGVEDSVVEHGFAQGPPALGPGQRATADFEMALPLGGLVVAPGESLVLRIGSYYADDAARGAVGAVVGGDDPTRIDLVTRDLPAMREAASSSTSTESLELRGGRCAGFDPLTDADQVWLDVEVPEDAILVQFTAERVAGHGPPDIDFVVLDAVGEEMAHALGSGGRETITLREPNLVLAAPGAWRLGVYACTPQSSTVDVTIRIDA